MEIIQIAIMVGLSILSIIDFLTFDKSKGYIPSFIPTTFLLITFALTTSIGMAIISGIVGLILSELNLWKGLADYKVYVAVGMGFSNLIQLLGFTLIMVLIGTITSWLIKKYSHSNEMPYIPIIMMAWCLSLWF